MADYCEMRKPDSLHKSYNSDCNSEYKCSKCVELVSQLDEACKELSSSQLIIQLLYKEISNITAEKTLKLTNTVSEYTNSDAVLSNTWSTVASKRLHNKNETWSTVASK